MIQILKKRARSKYIGILILFLYFTFWWVYKLDVLPGLHGDEAWVGLKAHQYNASGVDHVYGMTTYTGILQPLISSWAFQLMNLGVLQLRVAGPIFNIIALAVFCITLRSYHRGQSPFFFLLILAQSALYLVSPRVAWEVNTFTLFFLSLAMLATTRITCDIRRFKPFWIGLLLLVNVLGTYNHVLFSCISVSALIAVVIWSFYRRTCMWNNIIAVLIVNLGNLLLLFLVMRYLPDSLLMNTPYLFFSGILILILLEIWLFGYVYKAIPLQRFCVNLPPRFIYLTLGVLLSSFLIFHGMALYQVMANYKLIMHAYSFSFSPSVIILFLTGGAVIAGYLFFFLAEDIKTEKKAPFAFFIIVYLGMLSVYTTDNSFRYYLAAYAIISLYIAIKVSAHIKRALPLTIVLAGMAILTNVALFRIFLRLDRPVKAIEFTTGNQQIETSAHFLPNKPLISFLKENQIGNIIYLSDRYFLEQPILFYRLICPWGRLPQNTAIIDYDYTGNNQGYLLYKKE